MRNLKKILALVLALVMAMSVMTVASAKFEDSDKVNAKFATAVEVLNGLKVFQGYEDGTFKPTGAITRAEVAAIIYRIDTGDVAGKQVQIYADYNKFDDVKSTEWYAGYVNYCANATYIKGYDENTFGPNDKVTGYQALAMILRVVGYDKNGEFSGSAWQIETAKYAQKLGITRNVDVNTLGVAATRELVAELLFRTVLEVPQVTYTLLQGYNQYQDTFPTATSKLNPTIGEEMFGLATVEGQDEWGRPYTGWTSWGKMIVKNAETPVFEAAEAVTHCDITVASGLKGNVTVYYNGVEGAAYVNPLNTNKNNPAHLIGEQGTIMEIYSDRIVLIDTYLSIVTDTVTMVTDKAGHVARYPYNEFYIYGADLYATVDGNEFATGDYMLVMYNEEYEFVLPYAVPTTINAKQTHIWWNAEKHTIGGVEYNDNVNYTLDVAGYDKTAEYTWFFDTNNNVIGSEEIIIPEAAKVYAVVLGAQWINAIGENGYALGNIFYLDGTTTTDRIAKVDGQTMKYADTYTANFQAGTVCTTYQYNDNTEAHLYEVKETANGLELTTVIPELATVALYDGVSQIGAAYYTDNNTTFFFYNAKTGAIDAVVGYDNLPANYNCTNVDIVVNKTTGFVQFVYIPVSTVITTQGPAVQDVDVYEYVYITGDALNYKLKDRFAVLGVVDGEGNTDPLYFGMDYAGSEAATEAALNELVKYAQDTLCLVVTSSKTGLVKSIAPVALDAETTATIGGKAQKAQFVMADEYYFINTGVLVMADGTAINVNHNTTIINDGEVGKAVNDLAYLAGANLYIVYEGTTAKYIFVTSTARELANGLTLVEAMVQALDAGDFEDVSASFTYIVADDSNVDHAAVAAALAEAAAAGATVSFIDGLSAETVTVAAAYDADAEQYTVTVTAGEATKTVAVYVNLITVESVLEEAYALEDGEYLAYPVTLTGEISAINTAWSEQYKNITVTIEVEGFEDMPVMCYRLAGEGAADLKVGDTITVTGNIKNYKGTIEFDQGCTLDAVVAGETETEELTTAEEILTAAYALEPGESLPGVYTLTGAIISIDTVYSEQYNNITVTIAVEGLEDMPIQCYRLRGEGAAELAVGDVITVTGTIINYLNNSTGESKVEFNSGCTLDAVVKP